MSIIKNIIEFLDNNRQQGSTTAAVHAAFTSNGYLIVKDVTTKRLIHVRHPELLAERVLTLADVQTRSWRGLEQRPVFIDASVIWGLSE